MIDRDIVIRIDGMVKGASFNLVAVSEYIRKNIDNEALRHELILYIGKCLYETKCLSEKLYELHPDIIPPERVPTDIST